ncbi:SDR family oxidoreductase [Chitinophaga filiformis]|uniref:SDR family oxidoreductase n=1 Tax=Chitinophaga filiformis TaxID=104663 RepID=A0ABY4HYR6_CHIFI|nr:SDR family oxidoreductase [Chitinophaga filiformis]UPK68159.1 SDR family oxidoreductase [Chitinophaga filiformis]
MRVFVTGATGFVGTAVVQELLAAGHQVLGLARSEEAVAKLTAAGAEVHRGTLEDLDRLREAALAADGIIHTAFIHDFSNMAASAATDQTAITTFIEALAGTGKPLVVTSGIATIGGLEGGRLGTEKDAPNPETPGRHRVRSEEITLAAAARGLRASVVRLPTSVHDKDDHGFVPALINIARKKGVSAYIGEGRNRWPAVHRLDAARVYRLALEKGAAGTRFHAIGDEGIPTRDIAAAIGKQLGLPVVSIPPAEAADHFSWLGHFFAVDCPASGTLTQEWLGWQPVHPGLIEDLSNGSYFGDGK